MQTRPQRLHELDFFRGLVLLIIVVDHIGGSIVSRVTLHAYAVCDAAEVFVFLGGFATATAYASLAARHSETAARYRFVRRALEVYRAFLVTAGLMLLTSALLVAFSIDAPNLPLADLDDLLSSPGEALRDILLLRRQPYLASVLPMYACFAFAVPVVLPLAKRRPWLLFVGSAALWYAAPRLQGLLPVVEDGQWDFNPFAWQLLFVAGVIVRCQPVYPRIVAHRMAPLVTAAALAVLGGAAFYKLAIEVAPLDGVYKQTLAWFRVANFAALAWLVACMVQRGWIGRLARRLPWVGEIGRRGLLCFVAGTVISLVVDSVLYWLTDGWLDIPLGLAADAIAIGALVAVAHATSATQRLIGALRSRIADGETTA